MDQQPDDFNSPKPPETGVAPPISSSQNDAKPPRRHIKMIILVVVGLVLLLGAGGGFLWYQQQQQQARQQAALQAKAKADKEAAYQRLGTVQEIEELFETELKQEADENSRFIFNAGDSLQRESTAAGNAGANNATNL